MGKNNNAIQILRGTRDAIAGMSETLLPGQLLYNMTDNYITAGKAAADGSPEDTSVDSAPITVRELHGWTGDANGIVSAANKGFEYGIKYVEGSGLSITGPNSESTITLGDYITLTEDGETYKLPSRSGSTSHTILSAPNSWSQGTSAGVTLTKGTWQLYSKSLISLINLGVVYYDGEHATTASSRYRLSDTTEAELFVTIAMDGVVSLNYRMISFKSVKLDSYDADNNPKTITATVIDSITDSSQSLSNLYYRKLD